LPSEIGIDAAGGREAAAAPLNTGGDTIDSSEAKVIVAQTGASWNRMADWLRQVKVIRPNGVGVFQPVDMGDVRVVERRKRLHFARETRQPVGVARKGFRQDFQRDVAIELCVPSAIDLTHPAGTEGGENLIRPEARAGAEAHRFVTGAMRRSSSKKLKTNVT
jgi:hypothetical protein